jgi:divalent metal cation (Fe/Co/Zn/Cd) transporter
MAGPSLVSGAVDLTPQQRRREAALVVAAVLDGLIGLLLLVVGLAADSLTCFAESMRGNMMWTIDLVSLAVLRRVHRGRLTGFNYGTNKVEQLCSIAIGAGLLGAAAWLARDALHLVSVGHSSATPLGLCLAASVGAVNVFINFVAWDKVRRAAEGGRSSLMEAQRTARRARLLSSLVVQATMTGAAVAKDPLVVAWLDAVGALVVCAIMVRAALQLLAEAVPDLVDRSANHLAEPVMARAAHLLPAGATLESFRSRGTARAFTLEVALGCAAATPIEAVGESARILAAELAQSLPGVDIQLQVNAVSLNVGAG